MGWLVVAAIALVVLAGWCATAETALLRVSRAGAKEIARSPGGEPAPLQAVLTEISRYLSVLILVRVAGEVLATVLVTAVLAHRLGLDWRAFLIAAAIMIVIGCRASGGSTPCAWPPPPPPSCVPSSGCSARSRGSWLRPGAR